MDDEVACMVLQQRDGFRRRWGANGVLDLWWAGCSGATTLVCSSCNCSELCVRVLYVRAHV